MLGRSGTKPTSESKHKSAVGIRSIGVPLRDEADALNSNMLTGVRYR
jgi:hypothetical protein